METIYKVIEDCEVKKVGERQYEFTASTSTQDRDGEVIDAKGWDLTNFKKNPVIMYAHDYNNLPVGRASRVWIHSGKLKDVVEFPPEGTYEFADIVARLVDTGYLKTQSVGFIPKKWEDGDGEKAPRRTYTKQELLEISIVPIPSNPDAIREAVNAGVITTKQLEIITKPEETDEYIHIPAKGQEGKHDGHRIRVIPIDKDKGIQAKYCGECKVITSYMFEKAKGWTMEKARAWVKEHEKSVIVSTTTNNVNDIEVVTAAIQTDDIILSSPRAARTSQEEIIDEFDYLNTLIITEGISDKAKPTMWILVKEILRLHGSDMPLEIKELVSPAINIINTPTITVERKETLTNEDILEAIRRIAELQRIASK